MPAKTKTAAAPKEGTKQAVRPKPQAKFRMRITAGDVIAIGPGKIALIESIAQTGSITSAAKSLGMSYRRAWVLLDQLNRALKKPAVNSAKGGPLGGGSVLTDTGRELIDLYRRIELTATQACQDDLAQLVRLIAR